MTSGLIFGKLKAALDHALGSELPVFLDVAVTYSVAAAALAVVICLPKGIWTASKEVLLVFLSLRRNRRYPVFAADFRAE